MTHRLALPSQPWAFTALACPWCGDRVAAAAAGCSTCGRPAERTDTTISWQRAGGTPRALESLGAVALRQLNPVASRLSPLRIFSDWRVERYYRRTLSDAELAQRWRRHTFSHLEMPEEAAVLDYGCGRGRNVALLAQLGFRVGAQDIKPHPWWRHLRSCGFQVVPPAAPRLPWADGTFDAVLDVTVIHHLDRAQLQSLAAEVLRVLAPGGYWLLTEANSGSYGAAAPLRYYGRLHSLADVQQIAAAAGFLDAGHDYEGFYAPVCPNLVNFLRKQAWPSSFTMDDFDSPLASMMPASRRALWRLRLRKPFDIG